MPYLQLFSSLFDNALKLKSFLCLCDLVAELLSFFYKLKNNHENTNQKKVLGFDLMRRKNLSGIFFKTSQGNFLQYI
jgi:hypothetical protein